MKSLELSLILIIAASSGQISAQRSDFVDYLLQLQYITEPIYVHMTSFFADSRAELSVKLTELNDEGIDEITEALHAIIAIRERTEGAVANIVTEGNEECIAELTRNWPLLLQAVGESIADCADEHVDPIHNLTESFHLYVQEQNRVAFNVQNMVLNVFTHLNPLTTADEITPTIESEMDRLLNEFEDVVKPEIERILQEISNLRYQVPQEVHSCSESAISGFNNAAVDIYNNLVNC